MDNLVSKVARVYLQQGVSKKTGNPYTQLIVEWRMPKDKTYKYTTFLTSEQEALITLASQLPSPDNQLDELES